MRLVGWSSTSSTRLRSRSACSIVGKRRGVKAPLLPGMMLSTGSSERGARGSVIASRIVVPTCGTLSIVTRPPISSARRVQMARPRPVPPITTRGVAFGLRERLEQALLRLRH